MISKVELISVDTILFRHQKTVTEPLFLSIESVHHWYVNVLRHYAYGGVEGVSHYESAVTEVQNKIIVIDYLNENHFAESSKSKDICDTINTKTLFEEDASESTFVFRFAMRVVESKESVENESDSLKLATHCLRLGFSEVETLEKVPMIIIGESDKFINRLLYLRDLEECGRFGYFCKELLQINDEK